MLKLNVGISRKVGQPNYGSRGAAVSLEAEVESALTSDLDALQERIHALFRVADAAVEAELGGARNGSANHSGHHSRRNNQERSRLDPRLEHQPPSPPDPSQADRRHPSLPTRQSTNGRPATASQCRAIHAITSQLQLDVGHELRQRFGAEAPGELSLLEASEFIDWLKSQSDDNQSNGNQSNSNQSNSNRGRP